MSQSTIPLIFIFLISFNLHGQYDHQAVYPDLDNQDLYEALVSDYKPGTVLNLTQARDTLYKRIYLYKDSVSCIYTGLTKYLDPALDPSQALFEGGGNGDINLEHSYPRGKGASTGNANSDMHHLYPSRVPVNSDRASVPYDEISDNLTQKWYYLDQTITTQPSSNKDAYSEFGQGFFEPREDAKGNIARAYFYFYTMYRDQADAADPNFFSDQVNTLCEWHTQDPVDSLEWARTFKIASYQGGVPNPYVLDCRLSRLYCDNIPAACRIVPTQELSAGRISVKPTLVARGSGTALFVEGLSSEGAGTGTAYFYNLQGQLLSQQKARYEIVSPVEPGMYILVITEQNQLNYTSRIVVY